MPDLPKKKVGLIACSGEELATGTLSRVAVRLVLEELRPDGTVTLCLPLFLAGEKEERAFAKFYPTISVDGCDKWCARRATETHSAPVADAIRVDQVLDELGITVKPGWRRELDAEGWQAARLLAEVIAERVEAILGPASPEVHEQAAESAQKQPAVVTCSCGSGIPVSVIEVAGKPVEIVALPLLFDRLYEQGKRDGQLDATELLQLVKIYNPIPPDAEAEYREVLKKEYEAFCRNRTNG